MGVMKINLPYNLLKQLTQTRESQNGNDFLYGTVSISGDSQFVNLDGSDISTPVNTLTEIKDGDRVYCTIKNHEVQVLGNTTTPSTSMDAVTEDVNNIDSDLFEAIRRNILESLEDGETDIYESIRRIICRGLCEYYWDDLTEPPTLTNYPANTFVGYRQYKTPIDFIHTFSLTGDELYKRYLGARAFLKDCSRCWVFSYDNDTYYWREVDDIIKNMYGRIFNVENDIDDIREEIEQIGVDVLDDEIISTDKTWSSSKIKQELDNIDVNVIDDSAQSLYTTWSSSKIKQEIASGGGGGGGSIEYSTEEKVVGKWIDGKPLYQKTVPNLNVYCQAGEWTEIIELDHPDELIDCKAYRVSGDGKYVGTLLTDSAIGSGGYANWVRVATYQSVTLRCITVQYTKTTDSPEL